MNNNSDNQTQKTPTISEITSKAAAKIAFDKISQRIAMQEAHIQIAKQMPPPEVLTIEELSVLEIDHSATLLGDRWLCRGQAGMIVGPSGIGKSSMAMQQDLSWATGKEAFGIAPSKPLKILTIQAENDQGDLIEMVRGVKAGMDLTAEEEELVGTNVVYAFEQVRTGATFVEAVMRPLLEKHRPDVIRVDPLQAFAGCDLTNASEVAELLRNRVNPVLKEFQCGLILMHHTPKQTSNKDTSKNRTTDWMYSGAGSHDIVNWARAIIAIDPCKRDGVYKFIAAKRGNRIGWRNAETNEKETARWFKWATGSIYWEAAEPCEAEPSDEAGVKNLLELIPFEQGIEKKILQDNANKLGKIPIRKFAVLLERALEEDWVEIKQEKRFGVKPRLMVARTLKSAGICPSVTTRLNAGGIKVNLLAADRALRAAASSTINVGHHPEGDSVSGTTMSTFNPDKDFEIEETLQNHSEQWG